ncbi:MAG: hypothetical protein J7641_15195 [Cyanobacteria bacterium SID2]|nr:hypothetical protein [Cyanobacteria bacterium SID2]MBP0006532.1 hypothetical protein [Cyanobacteria bacterium SBC]
MTKRNPTLDLGTIAPSACFNELMSAYTEYLELADLERGQHDDFKAREPVISAKIKAKRDVWMDYLDRSANPRQGNFRRLFEVVDIAIASRDKAKLVLALHSITRLAQYSFWSELDDRSS